MHLLKKFTSCTQKDIQIAEWLFVAQKQLQKYVYCVEKIRFFSWEKLKTIMHL